MAETIPEAKGTFPVKLESTSDREEVPQLSSARDVDLSNSNRIAMSFKDVEDSVRHFDGSGSLDSFVNEFEEISVVIGLNDVQKLIFAKRMLCGNAKLFIQSESGLTSWPKLKAALQREFGSKITQSELHRLLSRRKLRTDESVIQYLLCGNWLHAEG